VQATHRALRQTSAALASGAAFLDRRRQAVVVTSSQGRTRAITGCCWPKGIWRGSVLAACCEGSLRCRRRTG